MLRTRGLQFDFPNAPQPDPPPRWLMEFFEALARLKPVEGLAPVVKYLPWLALAVFLLVVAWLFYVEAKAARRRKVAPLPASEWRMEEAAAVGLLREAQALADAGRFDEAVHRLLNQSIADLVRRRPREVRPALTSRDIAALQIIPDDPRAAFARIAARVEHSLFGGRALALGDFEQARADYEAFALPGGWR